MDNWELEWIGFLPGKRESRRYEGAYMLNQRDLEEGHSFPDTVAFGGWTMDNHSPLGFKYPGYSSHHITPKVPYEIPFRCLYSHNVPNLMFAGRNIGATHMAMSSTRVMATCALLGQAAGTGAAVAVAHDCLPACVTEQHIPELQKKLMDDGCYLPGVMRAVGGGEAQLSQEQQELLRNGWERPHDGAENSISLAAGSELTVAVKGGTTLRLALDPDFTRETISSVRHYQKYAMRTHVPSELQQNRPVNMPANLLKSCQVTVTMADGSQQQLSIENNRKPRIYLPLPENAVEVKLSGLTAWGGSDVNLFACDTI
jgi:hypothetical protein